MEYLHPLIFINYQIFSSLQLTFRNFNFIITLLLISNVSSSKVLKYFLSFQTFSSHFQALNELMVHNLKNNSENQRRIFSLSFFVPKS